jgi:tetratricopeptide (TPR) repeat protein
MGAYNPILSVADSLYTNQNYNQAITEYKRYLFNQDNQVENSDIYVRISRCYRQLSQPEQSIKYIDTAIFNAENDSLRSLRRIDKTHLLMSMQNYSLAEFILIREIQFCKYPSIVNQAKLTLSLDYILQTKWKEAKITLVEYGNYNGITDTDDFQALIVCLDEIQSVPLKDPAKAKELSTFFPGAGQFYCKDYTNSANALVINGLIVTWAVNSVLTRELLDVYPIVFLFWKYYQGNRFRAELLCKQYNEALQKKNISNATNKMSVLWSSN